MLFLSILAQGDSYVYEITKHVGEYSKGFLTISPSTIYTVAYKLEQDSLISEYTTLVGRKRTRIYYHLEEKGSDYLAAISQQYEQVNQGISHFFQALKPSNPEAAHE